MDMIFTPEVCRHGARECGRIWHLSEATPASVIDPVASARGGGDPGFIK
jgi:hypothetical protein